MIGGGLDEAPLAYKDIREVMQSQRALVDVIGEFNPKIVERSGESQTYGEGCLSVPGVDGDVKRALEVRAVWTDETGGTQDRRFTGHLARIVQHEVDHLNGIIIVNHLSMAARTLHRKQLDALQVEAKAALKRRVGK